MLEGMLQVDFNNLYDDLKQYAFNYATRLFSNNAIREDAVIIAMDKFTDELITKDQPDDLKAWGKKIIRDSLRDSGRSRKLEAIDMDLEDGFSAYQVV